MGSSASNLKEGAPANPRLLYSEKLSHNIKQPIVLDAPVLIDVDHGSIRYRYSTYTDEPADKKKRVERPHTGPETTDKQHYFYHARLKNTKDLSEDEEFKLMYVTKGPARAKQKYMYYVYGKGFGAEDGLKVHPSLNKREEKDFTWTANRKLNDLYYKLTFVPQDTEISLTESSEEELLISELESTPDKSSITLQVGESDTVSKLKCMLAIKLLKAASNIHVYINQRELRNEDVIGDLRDSGQQFFTVFKVQMSRI